jgi:hypothetical protein
MKGPCVVVVPPQTRTDAPAVFLNPVSSGLPGGILGPDDIANRG